jgi:polysaccharide biosynthesis protein PslH
LTSRFPYPLEKGDKLRAFHQLKELSSVYEIILVSLSDVEVTESDLAALRPYCKAIEVLEINKWKVYLRLVQYFVSGKLPLQVAYFVDSKLKKQVAQIISTYNPDHIYCQLIRTAEYVKNASQPKTMDLMDAFSEGANRRLRDTRGIMHCFWKREAQLLKKYEQSIAPYFDHLTIISEQDKTSLSLNHPSFEVVPNGVDTAFFISDLLTCSLKTVGFTDKSEPTKQYDIVFVGNMGYYPNIQAATYLVEQLLPQLNLIFPSLKVLIAGARPSAKIQSFANQQITVSGWIPDIRLAYGSAKILVAPLFQGSGQQNKILEAMSMSVPCITTTMVNNAIGAAHKENILIADTPDEFVKYIRDMLQHPEKRNKIGNLGQVFVENNFSWKTACRKLAKIINS